MAVAISSLPVPASPNSSTLELVAATLRVRRYTASIAGLLPIRLGMGGPREAGLWLLFGDMEIGRHVLSRARFQGLTFFSATPAYPARGRGPLASLDRGSHCCCTGRTATGS